MKMKKLLSMVTAVVLSVTMSAEVFAVDTPGSNGNSQTSISNEMQVTGTNSFGNMLAQEINAKENEQLENNGYNVFSVEVTGQTAEVELQTLKNSTVVVGVYTEDGSTLLQTANAAVTPDDETVKVTFAQALPEYFYIKAYLINSENMRPLCTVYECPNYTKEMQEFFKKTTADFPEDRVLNLDNDTANNFAVYSDDVKVISEQTGINNVTGSVNGTYVIENADENFTELKSGDMIAYEYGDNELILLSVDSISVNGSTVTITEKEASLEDAFEYIRIDSSADLENAVVDNSGLQEGVNYLGRVSSAEDHEEAQPYGIATIAEDTGIGSSSLKFSDEYEVFSKSLGDDNKKLDISGKIGFSLVGTVKYYMTLSQQYIEVSLDYEINAALKINASGKAEMKLSKFYIPIIPGINITVEPKLTFEVAVDADLTFKFSGSLGMKASVQEGVQNISKKPTFDGDATITGKLYVGIELKPDIEVINENIASVSLTGSAGIEVNGSMELVSDKPEGDKVHACQHCVDGSVKAKFSISFKATLLNIKQLTLEKTILDKSFDLFDFYFSLDTNQFGKGECPNMKYKVTFYVVDSAGKPLQNVMIMLNSGESTESGSDGYTKAIYLANGNYTAQTLDGEHREKTVSFNVDNSAVNGKWIMLYGINEVLPDSIAAKQIILGGASSAVITEEGDLYTWGNNDYAQLGNGTRVDAAYPMKVRENVASVDITSSYYCENFLRAGCGAFVLENGGLYVYGGNASGQLGYGTRSLKEVQTKPIRIMNDVKTVETALGVMGCLTNDGTLYLWGHLSKLNKPYDFNDFYGAGYYTPVEVAKNVSDFDIDSRGAYYIDENGSLYNVPSNTSEPIMENVVSVKAYGSSIVSVITSDGSLYLKGNNDYGQIGDGTYKSKSNFVKVMDNVASVSLGEYHVAAVTDDGVLYTWGSNGYGQLGTDDVSLLPNRIMDNVAAVSCGDYHTGVITKDGRILMWGSNSHGQLGNGTTTDSGVPVEVDLSGETALSVMAIAAEGDTFTGLIPNEVYNIYGMKSRTVEDPFSSDNLLYISQEVSDSNGTIRYDYAPKTTYPNPEIFCKAMKEFDVGNAHITSAETTTDKVTLKWDIYPGATAYKVYKVSGGIYSEEKETTVPMCIISGLESGKEYGFIVTAKVNGEWSYRSDDDVIFVATQKEDEPESTFTKGDVNGDGKIDILDLATMRRHLAGNPTEIDKQAADLDGNGDITILDLAILRRYLAGNEEVLS